MATMFCASVMYPPDVEYFASRHAPMFARLLGATLAQHGPEI
jgi:hypothetical protein